MNEHYYSAKQTSTRDLKQFTATLRNTECTFYTSKGVFSKDRIDPGTELLVNKATINPTDRILDLGCGIGIVGISLKKAFPKIEAVMTDINQRAIMLARKNAKLNKVNCKITGGNLYEPVEGKFETILINPPQSAGKDLCFQIIEQAPIYLKKGGRLQLVARHQKGGKSLSKRMEEVFGNVEAIAKKSGYRVYVSVH